MNHATFIPKRESWTDIALAKVVLAEDADGAVVEQQGLQGFVFRGQTDERQKERKWGKEEKMDPKKMAKTFSINIKFL